MTGYELTTLLRPNMVNERDNSGSRSARGENGREKSKICSGFRLGRNYNSVTEVQIKTVPESLIS